MIYPLISALFSIFFAIFLIFQIQKIPAGTEKMIKIAKVIEQGAKVFLKREFKTIIIIFIFIVLFLGILNQSFIPPFIFLLGAGISGLAGFLGMMISTRANVRTTNLARTSFPQSFKVAFWGGQVMGFLVVGLGLFGIIIIWLIFKETYLLLNYAFGASLIAFFMRVGGGIFTKSADVGADLVGKIEKGIPEDDPRNPAVIADQVGDNVGDIAGMGSDLFESYISTIIAAMILGEIAFGKEGLFLPIFLAAAGILSSIIGSFFVKIRKNLESKIFIQQTKEIRKAMEKGIIIANILMIMAGYFIISNFLKEPKLFFALLIGLIIGLIIGKSAEYYTSENKKPVLGIAQASQAGSSTVIIEGFSVGMKSAVLPILAVAIGIILTHQLGGLYGIALAGVGMLAVLGINLATNCYGPIADNSAGIAEMADLEPEVRQRTEALDAVGNSTAAAGKGFAIGSAALATLAWLVIFFEKAGIMEINFLEPQIIAGLFIGATLPSLFCSLTIKTVGRGALEIVKEVRRQFQEIPGLLEEKTEPDYARCIDLTTQKALKEMILPGILVILTPILVGKILGVAALGGVLAGSLITGFLLALILANSGGAWDNAKKFIEAGNLGGKGSEAHKAAIIGDTVGDPFKDTAGPSLNILMKLIGIVALISLPLFL